MNIIKLLDVAVFPMILAIGLNFILILLAFSIPVVLAIFIIKKIKNRNKQ